MTPNRLTCNNSSSQGRLSWPTVHIGVYITHLTPFLDSFLSQISNLDYPKKKISVLLYNNQEYHHPDVEVWLNRVKDLYSSVKVLGPDGFVEEAEARNLGMRESKVGSHQLFFKEVFANSSIRRDLTSSFPKQSIRCQGWSVN